MKKIGRIVLATDFSTPGKKATDYAVSLAKQLNIAVDVLHVFDTRLLETPLPYYPAGRGWVDEYIRTTRARGKEQLEKLCNELEGECRPMFIEGRPSKQIVKFTEENDIDLLIMGSHGYTGLDRLLIGSVAEYVVRHARCPVLVVKQKSSSES